MPDVDRCVLRFALVFTLKSNTEISNSSPSKIASFKIN